MKTFAFHIENSKTQKLHDEFCAIALYAGTSPANVIAALMVEYVKQAKPAKVTLVSEKELMSRLKEKLGIEIALSSLKRYRREGFVKPGVEYYRGSNSHVVYDWNKMLKFVKQRKAQPYSRLKGRRANGAAS